MDRARSGWFKSAHSDANQGCVEVLFAADQALLRHSRAPFGPALVFSRTEWEAFLLGVIDGQFAMP
jgi:Domain of unknown function (DUF397)